MKKLTLTIALVAAAGLANAAITLAPNGDFALGGTSWGIAAVGATANYQVAGGSGEPNFLQFDQTAGGWGGVAFTDMPGETPMAPLGITAGVLTTFSIDINNLSGGAVTAGIKIEGWAGGVVNGPDSGDMVTALSAVPGWNTYTFDYALNPGSTDIKFVPIFVGQPIGSSVGFDNVGVVPEPATLGLFGLAGGAVLFLRRFRG